MVICSANTLPMRSDTAPMIQPPSADATRVTLPIIPASALLRLKAAISAGMARLNICTSSASSAQPPKQPQKVLRSPGETCLYQCNMMLPFMVLAYCRCAASRRCHGAGGAESADVRLVAEFVGAAAYAAPFQRAAVVSLGQPLQHDGRSAGREL